MDQKELTFNELEKLAFDTINIHCIGSIETVNEKKQYFIKIDKNKLPFNEKKHADDFNEFLKKNFNQSNIDNNNDTPPTIVERIQTPYFRTPYDAYKGLLLAWKAWTELNK